MFAGVYNTEKNIQVRHINSIQCRATVLELQQQTETWQAERTQPPSCLLELCCF